jgi:hypothetical protein
MRKIVISYSNAGARRPNGGGSAAGVCGFTAAATDDFFDLIDSAAGNEAMSALRGAEMTGRPVGSPAFLDRLATLTGRDSTSAKRGPKPGTNRGVGNVSHRNPAQPPNPPNPVAEEFSIYAYDASR